MAVWQRFLLSLKVEFSKWAGAYVNLSYDGYHTSNEADKQTIKCWQQKVLHLVIMHQTSHLQSQHSAFMPSTHTHT